MKRVKRQASPIIGTRRRGRAGMTLVEMLTAIGVIALLISMLVIGINFVSARAKADRTRTMLQNLRSMLNEFEVKGGRTLMIDDKYLSNADWRVIQREVAPAGKLDEGNALRLPGNNPALVRTQYVIGGLLTMPDNRKVVDNLPPEAFLMQAAPAGQKPVAYKPPIFLDGWNNPIIYAPRRAAPVPKDPASPPSSARPADNTLIWGLEGLTINGESGFVFQPSDGKGLWVSAGPDGDFSTGDDNVYSDDSGRTSTGKKN